MRILHTESSLGWGGQEIRILTEAKGLINRGHQVELVCPATAKIFSEATTYGVPVRALPIDKKRFTPLMKMYAFLRQNHFDLINTHSSTDSWLAALACKMFADAPPIIRTRHVSTVVNRSLPTRWLYEKGCSHVVVTGNFLKEQLIQYNRLSIEHITSVPTGIDLNRFRPQPLVQARSFLGLRIDVIYIGILATLRDWKGHTVLFDALVELLEQRPTVRILIIGDGPYRDRLNARAATLGIADKLDFVGHRIDAERWLPAIDVFTLPSWGDEGVSQALMQAMACALPIVTTPVGSLTEVIHDGKTGLIVPPRDAHALAMAIAQLLDNREQAKSLGMAAHKFAMSHCSDTLMFDRMEVIFQRFSKPEVR